MTNGDWIFCGFVGSCLLVAALMFSLLVNGEIAGPRVAQAPSHATHMTD